MGISRRVEEGFTFHVETWFWFDPKSSDVVAGANGISMAIAAFEEAKNHYPNHGILLMQGGRVLRKWPEDLKVG